VTHAATLLTTPDTADLYRTALDMLNRSGVPYAVGGTYAFQYYAGISRSTKDFDIFVRPRDVWRVLDALKRAGFRTEIAFPHWLAKAHHGDKFIDVIYSSGNGVAKVDEEWFAHAIRARCCRARSTWWTLTSGGTRTRAWRRTAQ